jgi:seryl-tRNA(Sec) selenium transferase
MLVESQESVRRRCRALKRRLDAVLGPGGSSEIRSGTSEAGSGSLAAVDLSTWVLSISVPGLSPEELARRFRLSEPAVYGRVHEDLFLIDCRTVRADELVDVQNALKEIISPVSTG